MSSYTTPSFDFHYDSYDDSYDDDEEWWDHRDITFLRPDLSEEGKSVQWCLDHDFFQVEEGYWSGDWYYKTHPEENILHQERLKCTHKIRKKIENRRSRMHEKRNCPIRKAEKEMQDAALLNVLKDDLARMMRGEASREAIDNEVRSDQILSPMGSNSKGVAITSVNSKRANSMSDEEESSSDEDDYERKMAEDDRCWDGSWMADGFMGMFVGFDSEDYLEDEMMMFFEEQEEQDSSSPLQIEDVFLDIPSGGDVEIELARLYEETLRPRKLHLASGVLRRITEGTCPPKVRIVKLDAEDMERLLKNKELGNQSFSKGEFEEAIEHYEEALLSIVDNLFVAPADQIKQVINVLSNQSECHLRLDQHREAGDAATSALLFDENHDKSRIRRAKAELSIGRIPYLCQAEVDLKNVIEMQSSETSVENATSLLRRVKSKLKYEKKMFERENTNRDWDFYIRSLKSRCW